MRSLNKIFFLIVLASTLNLLFAGMVLANDPPMLATITAKSCHTCQMLEPVIEELKHVYNGRIKFVTLDVSSKSSLEEARMLAEENGISNFFEENKSSIPKVGIFCPGGKKTENIFTGETRKEIYTEALEYILFDTSTICSL